MFGFFDKDEVVEPHYCASLRGNRWCDFIGQESLKEKLKIAIQAAKERNSVLPHILISGTPGQGKSTLAQIVAQEYGVEPKIYICTAIETAADLIEICVKAEENSVHIFDETQDLPKCVQTMALPVLEDSKITVKTGKSLFHIPVKPFCIIGTTTDLSKITEPFRNRFGIIHDLEPYTQEDLITLILQNSNKLGFTIEDKEILCEIAKRSRGIPRNCNRLLLRIKDYCQVKNHSNVTLQMVDEALNLEGIDGYGLTKKDKCYIRTMYSAFGGGPVGVSSISTTMGEAKDYVSRDVEPFLIDSGFIVRSPRGRMLTQKGINYALEYVK